MFGDGHYVGAKAGAYRGGYGVPKRTGVGDADVFFWRGKGTEVTPAQAPRNAWYDRGITVLPFEAIVVTDRASQGRYYRRVFFHMSIK